MKRVNQFAKPRRPRPPAWIKPGARVNYHAVVGGPATATGLLVRTAPVWMCGHWSVWVVGKASSVACDALTPCPEGAP